MPGKLHVPHRGQYSEFQFIVRFRREGPGLGAATGCWRGTVLLVPADPRDALDAAPTARSITSIDEVASAMHDLLRADGIENGDVGNSHIQ